MYFLARYVDGSYRISEMGFPSLKQVQEAAQLLRLETGFKWIFVHFPRFEHVAAA